MRTKGFAIIIGGVRARNVVIVAYPGVQSLDVTGPLEVFAGASELIERTGRRDPRYRVAVVAPALEPLTTSSGLKLLPDASLAMAGRAAMSPRHFARSFRAQTGITPGRYVERLRLGGCAAAARGHRAAGWRGCSRMRLRHARDDAPSLLASARREPGRVPAPVSGRPAAGAGDDRGISGESAASMEVAVLLYPRLTALDAIGPTTYWLALEELRRLGAEPVAERFVFDGRIVTAAGVSAGIDMALALAERIAGERVAQTIQLAIEYDPQPPFNAGSPGKAPAAMRRQLEERGRFALTGTPPSPADQG